VLFKLDYGGEVDEISLADLPHCRELSFTGWTHDLFQQMCVMAGCDFLKGLPGIGIKKAHQHIRRTRDFMRALRALRFDGVQAPPGYEVKFQRALWTFKHQRVYCPRRREIVPLTEPVGGSLAAQASVPAAAELVEGEVDFLGPHLPVHIGQGIAEGRLHPVTHQPMQLPMFRSDNNTRSIEAAFSFDRQLSGKSNMNTAATTTSQQQEAHHQTMPPIAISAEVRQQFKKPRIAPTGYDAAASSQDAGPSQQQLLKPKHRPLRPRVPAAARTAQQYFPSSGKNDETKNNSKPSRAPLLTTLKAALQACDEPEDGAEVEEAERGRQAEFEENADFREVEEHVTVHDEDKLEELLAIAPDVLPESEEPALGRLFAARACGQTPSERVRLNQHSGSKLPTKEAGMMMHSPAPWDITPGFYAADPASAIAGGTGAVPSGARTGTALKPGRNAGRGSSTSHEPLSLRFQRDGDVDGDDRGEVARVREPLVDLSHLPEAAIEAAAATKAAVDAAAGEGEKQQIFSKFACKK
jgi:5'-3' exonuclease